MNCIHLAFHIRFQHSHTICIDEKRIMYSIASNRFTQSGCKSTGCSIGEQIYSSQQQRSSSTPFTHTSIPTTGNAHNPPNAPRTQFTPFWIHRERGFNNEALNCMQRFVVWLPPAQLSPLEFLSYQTVPVITNLRE